MYKHFFKRVFDIFCSALGLVLASPIMLIVAILVAIKLGSPIIFAQYRPGKDGKIFRFYKFRSMNNKTDANGNLLPDAERMTKFGRILRKTSFDELPQLWNILKGDMSFVGPRPKLVKDMVFYNEEQNIRGKVRPGLTGLAQANGRNLNTWAETFKYDKYYVEHLSLWLDIKILFKTFIKVLGFGKKEIVEQTLVKEAYYYGDHLLNTKQIDKEFYDQKLVEANELIKEVKNKKKKRSNKDLDSNLEKTENAKPIKDKSKRIKK